MAPPPTLNHPAFLVIVATGTAATKVTIGQRTARQRTWQTLYSDRIRVGDMPIAYAQ
jgi:hypothetical protein